MANRTEGIVRRHRQTTLQTAQRPGAPASPQAEVATPPLRPARRMLTIKDVVDRVLERLWRSSGNEGSPGTAAGGVLAGGAAWPLIGRTRLGSAVAALQRTWAASLAFARWVKTALSTWRAFWSRRSPAPGMQSPSADPVDGVVETKIVAEKMPVPQPRREQKNHAWYHRARPLSSVDVAPAAATPPPPRRPPVIVDGEVVPDHVVNQYADYCTVRSTCPMNSSICHYCIFEVQRCPKGIVRNKNIVDGEVVPDHVVNQYADSCTARSTCPMNSSICHYCIFEVQRCPKGIVRNKNMILHCWDLHEKKGGLACQEIDCIVRARTDRDLALHTHFCHRLNAGWWMEYTC